MAGINPGRQRANTRLVGLFIVALSLFGAIYAGRAGVAQALYHRAKYGSDQGNPEKIVNRCKRAYAHYPHNYLFSIWAMEQSWYSRYVARKDSRIAATDEWCSIGLEQNVHNSQLRLMKVRLLLMASPSRAGEFWSEFVEWQFWNAHNHAVMVKLYAIMGEYEKAVLSLQWVKGSEHYAEARRVLNMAWQDEMQMPTSVSQDSTRKALSERVRL